MQIIYFDDLLNSPSLPSCALTIGNFDGVHLGHQKMLNLLLKEAKEHHLSTAVMIFEPQPKEFFLQENAPARLTNFQEKRHILEQYRFDTQQIDYLIVANFNQKFRSLSAIQFADTLKQLNVTSLVLGDDFKFGHDRSGDSTFLIDQGFKVTTLQTVTGKDDDKLRVSSTHIRDLLQHGDFIAAKNLLGRDYSIIGQVQHGDKIGRTLDFPTANISLDRIKPALQGIYAVDVQVLDDNYHVIEDFFTNTDTTNTTNGISGFNPHSLFGAANVGVRPTINNEKEWRLEVHFPNFSGDLYDKILKVRFLHFLHGEFKYDGLEALKAGIQDDVIQLLAWRTHNLERYT